MDQTIGSTLANFNKGIIDGGEERLECGVEGELEAGWRGWDVGLRWGWWPWDGLGAGGVHSSWAMGEDGGGGGGDGGGVRREGGVMDDGEGGRGGGGGNAML